MITYGQALSEGRLRLSKAGISEYESDGFWLMSELLGMDRTQYLLRQREEIKKDLYDRYMEGIRRRCTHEPLQYITGHAYFMGYEFDVTADVLIPRMDTETLVIEAERYIKNLPDKEMVLDMCTGSGCIGIALAKRNPDISVLASDISEGALRVARGNASKLACSNISFVQGNLFENVQQSFDIIVSNPPYIRTAVIGGLMDEVRLYEPYNALDGYEDGLYFYREITKAAVKHLNKGGWLCYEIGYDQAEDVAGLMSEQGFADCRVVRDMSGLERVVTGCFK